MTQTDTKASRRGLVIHDSFAFVILTAATAVLFFVTLFLFRSFAAHRADLARQFSDRGRLALDQSKPAEAITALRAALSYAGSDREDELLLAQALGDAGHIDESTNYFLNLWETKPGDGFINLQLARLARRKQEKQSAINYYRASVFGSWNGDAVVRRREVRLELADYLISINDSPAAQTELQIAASNAPRDPALQIALGDALLRSRDPASASREYQKAFADDPRNALAYEKAGRLAYQLGDFLHARDWLRRAASESAGSPGAVSEEDGDSATLLKNAERLLVLDPERADTLTSKVARLLMNRAIAKKRLDTCTQELGTATLPHPMQTLTGRWATSSKLTTHGALVHGPANRDLLRGLIQDTEILTSQVCGPPQGDDALLLVLGRQVRTQ